MSPSCWRIIPVVGARMTDRRAARRTASSWYLLVRTWSSMFTREIFLQLPLQSFFFLTGFITSCIISILQPGNILTFVKPRLQTTNYCRYLLSMALFLMRIALTEILKPADRKSSDKGKRSEVQHLAVWSEIYSSL